MRVRRVFVGAGTNIVIRPRFARSIGSLSRIASLSRAYFTIAERRQQDASRRSMVEAYALNA
jgi:hypothetical protein